MRKEKAIEILWRDNLLKELLPEIHGTDHEIEKFGDLLRWKPDPTLGHVDINKKIEEFIDRGITKNDEEWRDFYRRLGYTLAGYWEVFYWEANNPNADKYKPDIQEPSSFDEDENYGACPVDDHEK